MASPRLLMKHDEDPAKVILDIIGDLSAVRVSPTQILLATYIRPEKTVGGIIAPESMRTEDKWQGKASLVLKLGSKAFENDEHVDFGGFKVEAGEWVIVKPMEGMTFEYNGVHCRLLEDRLIRAVIPGPDAIW